MPQPTNPNLLWLALVVAANAAGQAPVISATDVCAVLSRLSLAGEAEVRVRGVWSRSDIGESLWSPSECSPPIIKDGWQWTGALAVAPKDGSEFNAQYGEYARLWRGSHAPSVVFGTLRGTLATQKFKAPGIWPAYGGKPGYDSAFVASLLYTSVTDIESVPLSDQRYAQLLSRLTFPGPRKQGSKPKR